MSDIGLERVPSFLREVWALYGVGMAVLCMRFGVRIRTVGIRGFQMDDLFSFIVMIMYTCDAATVHLVYLKGSNVEAADFMKVRTITEQERAQYRMGSKLQLTAWYSYTALLWCLKGTMLAFFYRITTGLWQSKLVKWMSYICIVSYVAVVLTITFGCFPTYKNWQVLPDPGQRCTFKMQNFIVTVVLNVLTDAGLLCIPLPLLWTLQIPLRKKIVIGLLICSGFFVIAAAIIRVVLTLGSSPSGTNINRWGVRETIVGIISVNIPILRPLATKRFWSGKWKAGRHSSYLHTSSGTGAGGKSSSGGRSRTLDTEEEGELGPYDMTGSMGEDGRSMSEDRIIKEEESELGMGEGLGEILVQKTYQVETEDGDSASQTEDIGDWQSVSGKTLTTIAHERDMV